MHIIGITTPFFWEDSLQEAASIATALDAGISWIHLRKPSGEVSKIEQLIRAIPAQYHSRLVLHEGFELTQKYTLKGIHLNSRHPEAPIGYRGKISRSCHSLSELQSKGRLFDFCFLSPIFDSISKTGYKAAFSMQDLQKAGQQGVLGEGVIALGGVAPEQIPVLQELGFKGAAALGYLWQEQTPQGVDRQSRNLLNAVSPTTII